MKKVLAAIVVIAIVIGAAWFLTQNQTQPPVASSLTSALGTDTLFFAQVHKPYEVYRRHPARSFIDELAKIDWQEELSLSLLPTSATALDLLSLSWKELSAIGKQIPAEELLGGEIVLTVNEAPAHGVTLLSELRGDAGEKAWQKLIQVLRDVRGKYPWVSLEESSEGDAATVVFSQMPGKPITLHLKKHSGALLIGTEKPAMESLAARLGQNQEEGALLESAGFAALLHPEAPKDADVRVFVNQSAMAGIWEGLDEQMKQGGEIPPEILDEAALNGGFSAFDPQLLDQYRGVAMDILDTVLFKSARARRSALMTSRIDPDGSMTSFTCVAMDPESDAAKAGESGMTDFDFTRFVPENALAFSYKARSNYLETYDEVVRILEENALTSELVESLHDWEEESQLDIRRDLLAWQSGGFGRLTLSSQHPDFLMSGVGRRAFLFPTNDEAAAREGINSLLRVVEESYSLTPEQSGEYTLLRLGLMPGAGQVAVAVKDGLAVAALGLDATETLDRIFAEREGREFLRNEKWRGMDGVLRDKYASLSFADTSARWKGVAGLGKNLGLLSMFLMAQVPDPDLRENLTALVGLIQTVAPAFDRLSIMDAEGKSAWYEDGKYCEISRLNVISKDKQPTPAPAGGRL